MRNVIVYCRDKDEVQRLFAFVQANEEDYKFVRKYRRAIDFSNKFDTREDGRVFSCKDDKAEFRMRLMFDTKNYVI